MGAANHTLIERTTISGDDTGSRSVEMAAANYGGQAATLEHDNIRDCGECVHGGPWTIRDSYLISNGMRGTSDHYEDVYCNNTTVVLDHDTAFDPQNQVAEVFCRHQLRWRRGLPEPCHDHQQPAGRRRLSAVRLRKRIIAWRQHDERHRQPLRQMPHESHQVQLQDRWLRLRHDVLQAGAGEDTHGYWPQGGYYGLASYTFCAPANGSVWSDNLWDDDHRVVRCRSV